MKMTLEWLQAAVKRAGYTLSAAAWEDDSMMYACSREGIPGCYGHPRFEATYCKRTGWVRVGRESFSSAGLALAQMGGGAK